MTNNPKNIKFIIDGELLSIVANYLQTKPWGEVNTLLTKLMQLEKLENGDNSILSE